MNLTDNFPNLGEQDIQIFRLLCEKAVDTEDLLSAVSTEDVNESQGLASGGIGTIGKSIAALMEQGFIHRSGRFRYTITPSGFDSYAKSYIANYDDKENAVKDAVAAVDQTNTNALVASTGEKKFLVNHVLRLLQSRRDISAFVGTYDSVQVTQVSRVFKQKQAARRLLGSA